MAVKKRNDSPRKPIAECFFSALSLFPYDSLLKLLGEMGFDALALGSAGWVPESQYGSNDSRAQIEELGNQVIKCMQISLMDSFAA